MSFNVHFCDDKITEINILDVEADCCCAGYLTTEDNCCDDELIYAKGETEHAAANTLTLDKNKKEQVYIIDCNSKLTCSPCHTYFQKYNSNSPPLSQPQAWLLFSTLRL